MSFHHHDKFFEQLLPAIEKNVRDNEMLEPVMILQNDQGHEIIKPMGEFFDGSNRKNAIVPLVEDLFSGVEGLHLVALISECWFAEMKGEDAKASVDQHFKDGGNVRDLPQKREGVMVTIYSRDRRDKMFSMAIKPGRTGVEKHMDTTTAEGRLARDKPTDN